MPLSDARNFVRRNGWLSRQPPSLQDRMLAEAELWTIGAGDAVYGLDAPPGGIFGLAAGLVDVRIAPGPFPPRLVYIARPGWWVGEAAAVTGTPRRAELTARTEVSVLHVPARHLAAMGVDEPLLWKCLATLSVQHLDDALVALTCLSCTDPILRLAATLARLLDAEATQADAVVIPINHDDLGELANLSRNSVSRALPGLAAAGCVECGYGRVTVRPGALRAFLASSS